MLFEAIANATLTTTWSIPKQNSKYDGIMIYFMRKE